MNDGHDNSQSVAARCTALGLSLSQAERLAEADGGHDVVHMQ